MKNSDCFDSFEFAVDGVRFRGDVVYDEYNQAPWENNDCYGVVVDGWLSRDKYPCERILAINRGCKRLYDYRAIESDANEYHREVALDLAGELLAGLVRGEVVNV